MILWRACHHSCSTLSPFPLSSVLRYFIAQLLGAILGSIGTVVAYAAPIRSFEKKAGLVRGLIGSERSAAIVGLYYPNPNVMPLTGVEACFACTSGAAALEAIGTGVLAFVVFSLSHPRNKSLGESRALMVSLMQHHWIQVCSDASISAHAAPLDIRLFRCQHIVNTSSWS